VRVQTGELRNMEAYIRYEQRFPLGPPRSSCFEKSSLRPPFPQFTARIRQAIGRALVTVIVPATVGKAWNPPTRHVEDVAGSRCTGDVASTCPASCMNSASGRRRSQYRAGRGRIGSGDVGAFYRAPAAARPFPGRAAWPSSGACIYYRCFLHHLPTRRRNGPPLSALPAVRRRTAGSPGPLLGTASERRNGAR